MLLFAWMRLARRAVMESLTYSDFAPMWEALQDTYCEECGELGCHPDFHGTTSFDTLDPDDREHYLFVTDYLYD